MNEAREEILSRIRRATGTPSENFQDLYTAIPRTYIRSGALGFQEKLDLFTERLRDYDAAVHLCAANDVVPTIAQVLRARGKSRILIPEDFPVASLPSGFHWIPDRDLPYLDLDAGDGVISGCSVAIALTGTIALQNGAYQGRRALSLVPDYHLCLVGREQIFETVPEAFAVLAHTGATTTTLISGPSATSDIEMTRIKGVHGPRTLEVIVIL